MSSGASGMSSRDGELSSRDGELSSGGAFSGLRVIELAAGIPGPYAARFLADQGADVIKVESPQGDPYRGDPGFQALNRNKRSVVADDPEQMCAQLAPWADVLVVPSAEHAGRLRRFAPNAVIVSFPVWGTGVQPPGSAAAVPAVTGIGWNQISYTEGPVDLVLPVAAYGAGMLGAVAIAAGLYARLANGSAPASSNSVTAPRTSVTAPTYEVSEVAGSGAMQVADFNAELLGPEREGSSPLGSTGRAPAYRLFKAADDEWLFVACGTTAFYEAMLTAIGRTDLLGDPRLPTPPWGLLELEPLAIITPELEAAFGSRSRAEWLEILAAHDVPSQPVQSREAFFASELALGNGLDACVQHPELGQVRVPPQPFALSECPAVELAPAPLLGQHTDEVLAELKLAAPVAGTQGRYTGNRDTGNLPLAGVRAIDLSSFIAGPVITRHLAMLGADVIKIEPPQGEPFRVMGPYFNGWNQAKRSITLNLKEPADLDIFQRLVAKTDVVVENFRPGVAARLGCSEADLRAIRPDLISVQSPGYGSYEPMAKIAAFDPLLQALGGIMDAQGGADEPVFLTVPVHDVVTPLIATFGVIAALYHRAQEGPQKGQGQTVQTSLVQTTSASQAAEMVDYAGRPPTRTGGFDFRGPPDGAHYEQSDQGWVWQEEAGAAVPVCTVGFAGAEPAVVAGLVAQYPETEWGPLAQIGQLISGAGPPPALGPQLDEHRDEILSELGYK